MECLFKNTKLFLVLVCLSGLFLSGCGQKRSEIEKQVSQVPVQIEILRFDKEFYEAADSDLPSIRQKYPYLFPKNIADEVWLQKKNDTLFAELYDEVQKKYSDLGSLPNDLEQFFKHVKYYYPEETENKKVITVISEVDVSAKAIYADSLAIISLDTYLGRNHRFYKGFPDYLRGTFDSNQILPNLAESFLLQKTRPSADRTFLGGMIQQGKLLYAKETLLPLVKEEDIMGYTKEQLDWCYNNEAQMWRYFIDNKSLFDTDNKLNTRFLEPAPFSKFYLEIDSESPGRTGAWIGWQIVRSFMKNNNVTLQELFEKEAKELFEQSKYKPRK